jgi:hypothetical protein
MKKFFIALSVLAALMLTVIPSQALIGMPDDMPGNDAVVPFICDIDLANPGLNTLIVFTDTIVGGVDLDFHYTIHTVRSVTVYDDDLTDTDNDVVPTDAFTEVGKIAPAIRDQLAVDIDGDGVNDHYAGYIYYNNVAPINNNAIVGQFYFVDLLNGIAASNNIPMKEFHNALPVGFQAPMAPNNIELFSADALKGAMDLQNGFAFANANTFGLFPRYYIQESGDATWLIFWKSANTIPGTLHIDFYDADENDVSSNIPLDDELTIIDVEPYLPLGLFAADAYPKEGWINMAWTLIGATAADTAALRNLEILGWSYQQATAGAGAENWTVLGSIWRNVDVVLP